jgi:CRISPR-associated protein Csm5
MPGSAIKGALRTALLAERVSDPAMKALAETVSQDRVPRNLAQQLEDRLIGSGGSSRIKPIGVSDSDPVSRDAMKIFMMRVATLAPGGPGKLTLRWKQAPHGSVDGNRPAAGALTFAEMAEPGSVFQGRWRENPYYQDQSVAKALRWKAVLSTSTLMESANANSAKMLASHRRYAEVAELDRVRDDLIRLETVLAEARASNNSCLVCLGWGGGFLSKSGGPPPSNDSYRQILGQLHYYSRAIASGLPFPKTRQIVFLDDQPATLPGWALLEVD